ncbi:hypothetical protein [Streptomyces sp. BBFR102]|uniref:hypothetical protein n=1 Tax=Streptomyces sp. BBFR102 TaxID=3448171 RepID=UPI003F53D785
MTQRHTGLKNKCGGGTPDAGMRLGRRLSDRKTTLADKNSDIVRLRDDARGFLAEDMRPALANEELREVFSGHPSDVTPLRRGTG